MLKRHFIVTSILMLLSLSCHQNHNTAKLTEIWDYIGDSPDSALSALNEISQKQLNSDKARAEYALLKTMATDKCFIDVQSDSLIQIANQYFSRKKDKNKQMLCQYYLGVIQLNMGDYSAAIISMDKAERLAESLNNALYQGLIVMAKRAVYTKCYNYQEALRCDNDGIQYFYEASDSTQANMAKIMLAADLQALRQYDNASAVYDSLLATCSSDTLMLKRVLPSYATMHVLRNKPDTKQAVHLFSLAIQNYHAQLNPVQLCWYAVALHKEGDIDQAYQFYQLLNSNPSTELEAMQCKYLFLANEKNYSAALSELEKLTHGQESRIRVAMEQSVLKAQRDFRAQENIIISMEADRRKTGNAILAFLAIILGISVLFAYLHGRKCVREIRLKSEEALEESRKLVKEIEAENGNLNDALLLARKKYVAAYKSQFRRIAKLTETYRHSSGLVNSRDIVYKHVSEIASNIADDQPTFKQLERDVNLHLNDSMKKYRKAYPGQEEKHYHFVCYLMAGFPASTIQLLTGEKPSNVYLKKTGS